MSKQRLQTVWWLCMMPPLAAMAMLSYQWYLHRSETILLIYAIACLIVGVLFGSLIVGASSGEEGKANEDSSEGDEPEAAQELNPKAEYSKNSEPSLGSHLSALSPNSKDSPAAGSDGPSVLKLNPEAEARASSPAAQSPAAADKVETFALGAKTESALAGAPLVSNDNVIKSQEDLAREFLTPISERPLFGPEESDSFAPGLQFGIVGEPEPIIALVPTELITPSPKLAENDLSKDAAKSASAEKATNPAAAAVSAANSNTAAAAADGNEQNVERAQQVVMRLEAEVAKAEAVAAKLQVELEKAEPMAARLQSAEKAINEAHKQARKDEANKAMQQQQHAQQKNSSQSIPKSSSQSLPQSQSQSGTNKSLGGAAPKQSLPPLKQTKVKTSETKLPELKSIDEWLTHAEKMIAEDNLDAAIRCYDQITKIDIKSFEAWYLKAVALRRKGLCEDAIYCVNYALGIRNQSSDALAEKGECLLELGKTDQAIVWFDKSLSIDKVAPKPWLGKGKCLAAMSRHKDAVACYDKVLAIQPDNQTAKEAKKVSAAKIGVKS